MSDLISRSALIRTIKCRKDVHKVEYARDKRESDFIRCCECSEIERLVNDAPTVEAKPVVYGEWIKGDTGEWQCSVCREENCYAYCEPLKRFTDLYCPNCGADMRGEKHD